MNSLIGIKVNLKNLACEYLCAIIKSDLTFILQVRSTFITSLPIDFSQLNTLFNIYLIFLVF